MCTSYLSYDFPKFKACSFRADAHVMRCTESEQIFDYCSTLHILPWMVLQGQHTNQRAGFACSSAHWLCGVGCSSPRLVYAAASTEDQCELHDCTHSTGKTCQLSCSLENMTAFTLQAPTHSIGKTCLLCCSLVFMTALASSNSLSLT